MRNMKVWFYWFLHRWFGLVLTDNPVWAVEPQSSKCAGAMVLRGIDGRAYLVVNGLVLAMEGDPCRHRGLSQRWTGADIEFAASVINVGRERLARMARHARRAGARSGAVTPDGYTKLPEQMIREAGLGPIWFFKAKNGYWSAYTARQLDELLGYGPTPPVETPEEAVSRRRDFVRADSDRLCAKCNWTYAEHPADAVVAQLRVLCDGTRVTMKDHKS